MNEELVKSLTDLIEETISEIEDLKKSRFSASEVKIAGPGEDGIKGHKADGKLDKEEDKDDDDDDDDKDDKDDKDMDKAEDKEGDPADSEKTKQDLKDLVGKKEDKEDKDDKKKDDMDKAEQPKEGYDIKKSLEDQETLMKSYIDNKVAPLETKLNSLLDLVGKIAEQPVPAKGASAKNFAILSKSAESEVAPLSKSQVANKLFELKKSGASVDSADITAAELGTTNVQELITKYNLK